MAYCPTLTHEKINIQLILSSRQQYAGRRSYGKKRKKKKKAPRHKKEEAILIPILIYTRTLKCVSPGSFKFYKQRVRGIPSIYLITVGTDIFVASTCTLSSRVDITTKTKRLSLVGPAICLLGLVMAKPIEAPLTSESLKQSDGYNKYDSTTVRPNFCWTSFGVSICKQVDGKIRQDDL